MSTTTRPGESHRAAEPPAGRDPDHDAQTPSPDTIRSVGLAESLATGVALVLCVMARVPHRLLDALGIRGWVLGLVVVIAVVSGVRAIVRAPFPRSRSQNGALKTLAVTIVVGAALTIPLYALLRATPAWWLLAGAMFAVVTIVGAAAMPFSLRLQSGPLAPAPDALAERVRAIGVRAGVDVGTVLVAGSASARCNAYVVGLGPTRRVVLDGSLAAWPAELIDQVVAHELGHWRLGHADRRLPLAIGAQLLTLALAAWLLSFAPLLDWAGISEAGDPRSFPLLLLLTPALVLPARCLLAWRDRHQERAADQFALALLDAPGPFAAMLDRAAEEGGAPRRLPWWRRLAASHPPIDERAFACTQYASSA
jgi:Zn-dependent protease with chaperone function